MAHDNVELLKQGVDAFNRGDMDAMLAIMDPDLEFVTAGVFPGIAPVYRGHDGWVAFWRDFRATWESLSVETNEFREAGDQVVLLMTFEARGRNGLEVHRKFANVWTIRDGLAVKLQSFGEWSAALEAVGLADAFETAHRSHRASMAGMARTHGDLTERDGFSVARMLDVPQRSLVNSVMYEHGADFESAYGWLDPHYADVDAWTVWVPQQDTAIAGLLKERGHVLDADPVAMFVALDSVTPPATLPEWQECSLEQLARINESAYPWQDGSLERAIVHGIDPSDYHLYEVADQCALGILDHGDDSYVTFVATRPEARGRGLASGLLAAGLLAARERGQKTSTLVATKSGAPVYARLGYETVGVFEMWEKRRA